MGELGSFCICATTFFLSNKQSNPELFFEMSEVVDELGHSFGLIGGQCIHRIDDDGFDAFVSTISVAIIHNGKQKTFGFTRPGSRCNDGGLRRLST